MQNRSRDTFPDRSYPLIPKEPQKTRIILDHDFPFRCDGPLRMPEPGMKGLHIHRGLEIGLCVKGEGIFVIEEKIFPFEPGDVFFINHLEMHYPFMPDNKPSFWYFSMTDPVALLSPIISSPEVLDPALFAGRRFCNRFTAKERPGIHSAVKEMVREATEKSPFFREKIKAHLMVILVELSRLLDRKPLGKNRPKTRRTLELMSRLAPAVDKITREYGQPLSVETLAWLCCMSPGHFRRRFRLAFHKSPADYLNDYRIAMICHLLKTTDRAISEVAVSCGFPTLSCFNRQFQKRKGCQPREWRKRGG